MTDKSDDVSATSGKISNNSTAVCPTEPQAAQDCLNGLAASSIEIALWGLLFTFVALTAVLLALTMLQVLRL